MIYHVFLYDLFPSLGEGLLKHIRNNYECSFSGAATVRISIPTNMQSTLIFHYNLKFYDSDGDSYDGISLKRFVMQVNLE